MKFPLIFVYSHDIKFYTPFGVYFYPFSWASSLALHGKLRTITYKGENSASANKSSQCNVLEHSNKRKT